MLKELDPFYRAQCPCCGYPTLPERARFDICGLCFWEDDGQDDPHADEVWGGPNHDYSLSAARENFRRYLVIYEPDRDPRIGGADNDAQLASKRALIAAFDRLTHAHGDERNAICEEILRHERTVREETRRRMREVGGRDGAGE